MTAETPKVQAIRYWWSRAEASLAAAQRELAAEDFALAINRAYYALFYAVSTLLLEEGTRSRNTAAFGLLSTGKSLKQGVSLNPTGHSITASFGIVRKGITSPLPSLTIPMSRNSWRGARLSSKISIPF